MSQYVKNASLAWWRKGVDIVSRHQEWRSDEQGAIAIIFALYSIVAILVTGGAIDMGRVYVAHQRLQAGTDATVLAAGRVWQTEHDIELAQNKALAHFNSLDHRLVSNPSMAFSSDALENTITLVTTAAIKTPFLSLGRIQSFEIKARAQAMLAAGGNAENNLEVALMLDITGSMAGNKIADLKLAAKDLIDILIWDDQSEYTSRIALIPFADAVHLGSTTLVTTVRGALKDGSCNSSSSPCTANTNVLPNLLGWTMGAPAKWYRFRRPDGGMNTWQASSYCVTERTGADWATDAAPTGMPRKVAPSYGSSSASSCGYMQINPYDPEVNSLQPLTSDTTLLKRRIDKLVEAGSTAGQLGIAWAWYTLSPNWATVWPAGSGGKPYHTDKVDKIAVLMTDGEFNTGHCSGIVAQDSGYGSGGSATKINCNASNGTSNDQAQALCSAMKSNTGIRVYTIGFDLNGNETAINTLRNCATDPSMFYEANDGDALRQSFRDIAIQVSKLRLSQ